MTAFGALVIILVLILPLGFGASFALYRPAELGLPSRLALALSCGFAIPAFCSYAFVLFEEFYGLRSLPYWARRPSRAGSLRGNALSFSSMCTGSRLET